MKTTEMVILLAHGSQSSQAGEDLEEVASQVREGLGGRRVILAFLQFNHPSLAEAIDQAVAEGGKRIVVVPFFLVSGRHVRGDVPAGMKQAKARNPRVEILLSRPLLPDPRIAEIVVDRIGEAMARKR